MNEINLGWTDIAPLKPKTAFPTKGKALKNTINAHCNFIGGMVVTDSFLITSSEDCCVKVWNRKTLKFFKDLGEYKTPVNFLALSPDEAYLATADDSNQVLIYELPTSKEPLKSLHLHKLKGHTDYVSKLAFAGDFLISASKDGTVKVWDYKAGTLIHTLRGHKDWVYALATSPDGKWAISSALNSSLIVWDIRKGKEIERLLEGSSLHYVMGMTIGGGNPTEKGNREAPNDIMWIGDKVVTVASDIAVWDAHTWEICWYQGTTNRYKIKRVSYMASENILITAGERIEGWDLDTGAQVFSIVGHEGEEAYSCTLWNEDRLYTGGKKGDIKAWDIKNLLKGGSTFQHTSYVYTLMYLPEAQRCVTTSHDGSVIVYDQDAKPLKQITIEKAFGTRIGAVLPTQPHKIAICSEGRVSILDTLKAEIVDELLLDNSLVNIEDLYALSDTKFVGTTLSYLPRLMDFETKEIKIYDFPFAPTHFVPFGDKMLFTSYPTTPLDSPSKDKNSSHASLKKPSYKKIKGLDTTGKDLKHTSCFFVANIAKLENVTSYWLPEYIKLAKRYDKSYPMFAHPINEKIAVIQYSGGELVVWNIPDSQVISVINTPEEEYLQTVFVYAGKLHAIGKSCTMRIYDTKTLQVEQSILLAHSKMNNAIIYEDLLLFAEDDNYLVVWDLQTNQVKCKVNLGFKISKIHLYQKQLFVGSGDGRLFSFEL